MLTLSEMFTDHAVLQRDMPLPVFGSASPGEEVSVAFRDAEKSCRADEKGCFRVTLPALPAGGPFVMTVKAGNEKITLSDLYIGEVWLAGGQSNMEAPVCCAKGGRDFINLPMPASPLRIKNISRRTLPDVQQYGFHFFPESSDATPWNEASGDALARFSAIGAAFGRNLAESLNVPVGIISCNFGATRVQPWTSPETLKTNPAFAGDIERFDDMRRKLGEEGEKADARFNDSLLKLFPKADEIIEKCLIDPIYYFNADAQLDWPPEGTPASVDRPGCLWENMLSRVFPYACRGAIWYQGESSATYLDCDRFKEQTRAMIADWRRAFENEDLWFAQTQLAPYDTSRRADPCDWPLVRQAQSELAKEDARTLCAHLTGIGEARNIHPVFKFEAAKRLSELTLSRVYGLPGRVLPPEPIRALREGKTARVLFANAEGLHMTAPLTQLETGADGKSYRAAAGEIRDNALIVADADEYIRFGYAPMPEDFLQNGAGIPAGPFTIRIGE